MSGGARDIAIFAAMAWECRPVLRGLRQVQRERLGPFPAWRAEAEGRRVIVVRTGIGIERAREAAELVLRDGSYDLFLSTGCAGGLRDGTAAGDLVVASDAVHECGAEPIAAEPGWSGRALAIAGKVGLVARQGPVLCVDRALTTRSAKAAAAARGMIAVEMEGTAIAAAADSAGISYLSVRVILDDADTELIDGGFIDNASGRMKPLALVRYLAGRPSAVAGMLAMHPLMRTAERNLERFFRAWFISFPPIPM